MERFRIPLIIILVSAVAAGSVMFILRQNTSSCPVEIELPTPSKEIMVYVSGEVRTPGEYTISEGARVSDAVEVAGGFTAKADQSAINKARKLRDGDHVQVYGEGESSQRININIADVWLLDALPSVGESTAQKIIDYRTENGPFDSIEEIKEVKGIGDSTFEKLKEMITVH